MSKTTALIAAAGLAASWNARASDINWMNTSGGSFATASNWSPAQVPGAADRALFSRGSSYIVHLNGVSHTNSQLLVSNDTVQFNLDGATYSLTSSASLSIGGGEIIILGHPIGLVGEFLMESTTPTTGVFNSVNAYIGGNSATPLLGSGTINVYGGVTWHNSGLLLVGGGAPGTLNILGTGDVTSGTGLIGQTAAGSATVDAAGSTWTLTSNLDIASNSNGTLSITNGGLVHNTAGRVAIPAGATGTVSVTGASSRWECTGPLTLGSGGTGSLTIGTGGSVSSNAGAGVSTIGGSMGSHGSLSISGNGSSSGNSRWLNSGVLKIGGLGAATVDIGAGGLLDSSGNTSVGDTASASATVNVSGALAAWDSGGALSIGGNASGPGGPATVTIGPGAYLNTPFNAPLNIWGPGVLNLNGGTIVLSSLNVTGGAFNWNSGTLQFLTTLLVGPGGPLGSTPTISSARAIRATQGIEINGAANPTMSVPGGVVFADSLLRVGDTGSGTLNLTAAAVMTTPTFSIGEQATGNGLVHLDGVNTQWTQGIFGNVNDVYVGNAGTGALQITGGAGMIDVYDTVDIGNLAGSHGSVLVSGQNSLLQLQNYFLSIGRNGVGSVDVQSGGQVIADATVAEVSGSGSISISGAGSAWTARSITLGHAGPGGLNISAGGSLATGDLYMADGAPGSATATVSGAGSSLSATQGNGAGGQFSIGGVSTASLTIENSAHASAYETFVGDGMMAVGTLTIRDPGSTFASSNELDAGFAGSGTINIQSGAAASTLTANIGRFAGSTGLLTVDGPASALNVGSQLYVGGGAGGRVNITNGGAIYVSGPATVNPTGTIALTSTSMSALYIALSGGALQGTGTITADLNNSGSVSPGNSAGLLTVQGAYAQTAAGSLNIEIGGTTPGSQHDRLAISGAATLGGTLNISLINGYTPHATETFIILTASSISGAFSTVHFPALSGGGLRLIYGPTSVSVAFCYANCDGSTSAPVLNINDFVCFQSRFAAGDPYANCDGSTTPPVLNINDFVCFQSQFAAGCP